MHPGLSNGSLVFVRLICEKKETYIFSVNKETLKIILATFRDVTDAIQALKKGLIVLIKLGQRIRFFVSCSEADESETLVENRQLRATFATRHGNISRTS